jgi:hypothetical protein
MRHIYHLILLTCALLAARAPGQSPIQFTFDYDVDTASRSILGLPAGPITLSAGLYDVAILFSPTGSGLTVLTTTDLNSSGPGHYVSGNIVAPLPAASPGYFQALVWENTYGNTYEAALASPPINGRGPLVGASAVVVANIPGGLQPPIDLGNVNLSVVPEPGTWAVVMVGILSYFAFARKRR